MKRDSESEASQPSGVEPVPQRQQRPGWPGRFAQQYVALMRKNGLVSVRNWQATAARVVIAPLFFISLIWLVNEALTHGNTTFDPTRSVKNPMADVVAAIPNCNDNIYTATPCLDFVYAPSGDANVKTIINSIRENNPGRQIPSTSVRGFASRDAANAYESANPQTVLGGLFFETQPNGNLGFVLQSNSTSKDFNGNYQDPNTYVQIPLQVAAEREISRLYFQRQGRTLAAADWNVALSGFAHPPVDNYSLVGSIAGPFVFAANMFAFVLVIQGVVAERELKLRQALRAMGMMDSAFWLSWASFELALGLLTALLLAAFGAMWQFSIFLHNSFGLIFFTFFLFQMAMSSLAFLLSTFVSKASTAVNIGFVIFIIGWIVQVIVVFGFPYSPSNVSKYTIVTILFSLCPFALLAKAFNDLALAAAGNNPGLSWGDRSSYCKNLDFQAQQDQPYTSNYVNYNCVLPISQALGIMFAQWVVYFVLAVWLDNVLPNENGVRRRGWYFLLPSYWGLGGRANFRHRKMAATAMGQQRLRPQVPCPSDGSEVDPDVAAEAAAVQALVEHRTGRAGAMADDEAGRGEQMEGLAMGAVEVYGLQKVFRKSWTRFLQPVACCLFFPIPFVYYAWRGRWRSEGGPEFWALKGPWFTIPRGQLFCLLGPNGAGKTTAINCLTGVLPPSGGDALVFGEALSAPGGMDRIRARMGVCPQFDILWHELTGTEHVRLYGAIKGIPRRQVKLQSAALLGRVKLTEAASVRTGAYSGGMRRRLSVAIALLGDPEVVYLDEPTTGMDPISRRFVWDIIEEAKPGRAIVLTTHSMEEADILGDRIGIMARGQLRALGSSLRLKQRFGSGYQVSVSVAARRPAGSVTSNLAGAGSSSASLGGLGGAGGSAASLTSLQNGDPQQAARTARVKDFFQRQLGLAPADETRAYVQLLVPRALEDRLPAFLQRLEAGQQDLGVTDIQIGLTSLEEVFLSVALKAEAEAAAAEQNRRKETVHLENGHVLEVHPGQETARDGADGGQLYSLTWAQDADGGLQVARWEAIADEAANGATPNAYGPAVPGSRTAALQHNSMTAPVSVPPMAA